MTLHRTTAAALTALVAAVSFVAGPRVVDAQERPPPASACDPRQGNCRCEVGSRPGLGCQLDLGNPGGPPAAPGPAPGSGEPPTTITTWEDLYPGCTEARETNPEACAGLECEGPDGGEGWWYLYEVVEVATGTVLEQGTACLGEAVEEAPPAVPTLEQVLAATDVPAPAIGRSPSGRGLTGLASWFWVDGAVGAVDVDLTLQGWTVSGTLRATSWRWTIGGTTTTSAGPGSEADPAVEHVFERKGTVEVAVEVSWAGEYTVTGYGTSLTVPGLATSSSSSLDYEVVEVRGVIDAPVGERG